MSIFIHNFRRWWQPPRNLHDRPEHRQVTFLELFYDLVYVVLIAELTHALASHVDLEHLRNFAFLFIIVWWAWLNGTIYHELHGNNDIRTRVFTFLQMFTVAGMAVFAHDALGETSVGFALSFTAFQLILTYMWWRTGVHDPNHRPLSRPYVIAFLINTLLFFASVFVDTPDRFYLWGIATLISIILPVIMNLMVGRDDPNIQAQIELSTASTPSLVERFGLFNIIVLGEVLVAVVQGVAGHHDLTLEIGVIGALGMLIAIGLWWVYFDFVSHRLVRKSVILAGLWMYMHLLVTAGIATIGAAVLNVIKHANTQLPTDVRWLLVVSIAIVLIGISIIMYTLQPRTPFESADRKGQIVMMLSSIAIILLGFTTLETIPLLGLVIVFMLAPVLFGLTMWINIVVASESE